MVLHWADAEWSQVGREAEQRRQMRQVSREATWRSSSRASSPTDTLVRGQHTRIAIMKFSSAIVLPLLSLGSGLAAAASWSFEDATLSISSKGAGVGGALKEK